MLAAAHAQKAFAVRPWERGPPNANNGFQPLQVHRVDCGLWTPWNACDQSGYQFRCHRCLVKINGPRHNSDPPTHLPPEYMKQWEQTTRAVRQPDPDEITQIVWQRRPCVNGSHEVNGVPNRMNAPPMQPNSIPVGAPNPRSPVGPNSIPVGAPNHRSPVGPNSIPVGAPNPRSPVGPNSTPVGAPNPRSPVGANSIPVGAPNPRPPVGPNSIPVGAPNPRSPVAPNPRPPVGPNSRTSAVPNPIPATAPKPKTPAVPNPIPATAPKPKTPAVPNPIPATAPTSRTSAVPNPIPATAPTSRTSAVPNPIPATAPTSRPVGAPRESPRIPTPKKTQNVIMEGNSASNGSQSPRIPTDAEVVNARTQLDILKTSSAKEDKEKSDLVESLRLKFEQAKNAAKLPQPPHLHNQAMQELARAKSEYDRAAKELGRQRVRSQIRLDVATAKVDLCVSRFNLESLKTRVVSENKSKEAVVQSLRQKAAQAKNAAKLPQPPHLHNQAMQELARAQAEYDQEAKTYGKQIARNEIGTQKNTVTVDWLNEVFERHNKRLKYLLEDQEKEAKAEEMQAEIDQLKETLKNQGPKQNIKSLENTIVNKEADLQSLREEVLNKRRLDELDLLVRTKKIEWRKSLVDLETIRLNNLVKDQYMEADIMSDKKRAEQLQRDAATKHDPGVIAQLNSQIASTKAGISRKNNALQAERHRSEVEIMYHIALSRWRYSVMELERLKLSHLLEEKKQAAEVEDIRASIAQLKSSVPDARDSGAMRHWTMQLRNKESELKGKENELKNTKDHAEQDLQSANAEVDNRKKQFDVAEKKEQVTTDVNQHNVAKVKTSPLVLEKNQAKPATQQSSNSNKLVPTVTPIEAKPATQQSSNSNKLVPTVTPTQNAKPATQQSSNSNKLVPTVTPIEAKPATQQSSNSNKLVPTVTPTQNAKPATQQSSNSNKLVPTVTPIEAKPATQQSSNSNKLVPTVTPTQNAKPATQQSSNSNKLVPTVTPTQNAKPATQQSSNSNKLVPTVTPTQNAKPATQQSSNSNKLVPTVTPTQNAKPATKQSTQGGIMKNLLMTVEKDALNVESDGESSDKLDTRTLKNVTKSEDIRIANSSATIKPHMQRNGSYRGASVGALSSDAGASEAPINTSSNFAKQATNSKPHLTQTKVSRKNTLAENTRRGDHVGTLATEASSPLTRNLNETSNTDEVFNEPNSSERHASNGIMIAGGAIGLLLLIGAGASAVAYEKKRASTNHKKEEVSFDIYKDLEPQHVETVVKIPGKLWA
ncbi:uncharacterized protein BXIN_1941 [Babesia sp. Xinjiang]|uniref:uncharacterized protein n=1 Tax=Babesia sp. Xinjiang TaxID=462227 RepID=UPI000A244117|nr:uncharacterized protein BXIN_1941 [Babesia sp. Xinjiang]ORM40503.1 hypothetical protein BXIN_1941 [Babesia sp. Xinjiang]